MCAYRVTLLYAERIIMVVLLLLLLLLPSSDTVTWYYAAIRQAMDVWRELAEVVACVCLAIFIYSAVQDLTFYDWLTARDQIAGCVCVCMRSWCECVCVIFTCTQLTLHHYVLALVDWLTDMVMRDQMWLSILWQEFEIIFFELCESISNILLSVK